MDVKQNTTISFGKKERKKGREIAGWRIVIRSEQTEWSPDNQCSGRVGNQLYISVLSMHIYINESFLSFLLNIYIYIYLFIYVCVCRSISFVSFGCFPPIGEKEN